MKVNVFNIGELVNFRITDNNSPIYKFGDENRNILVVTSENAGFTPPKVYNLEYINFTGDILAKELFKIRMILKNISEKEENTDSIILFNSPVIRFRTLNNISRLVIKLFGMLVTEEEMKVVATNDREYEMSEIEGRIIRTFKEIFDPSKNGTYAFKRIIPNEELLA